VAQRADELFNEGDLDGAAVKAQPALLL